MNLDRKLVNLTSHTINICPDENITIRIKPDGVIARLGSKDKPTGEFIHGIPIFTRTFGQVHGVPKEISDDNLYIVSSIVLAALPDRPDICAPDTGRSALRDEDDRIVGVTRLIMNK